MTRVQAVLVPIGELADPIAVFVGAGIGAKFLEQFLVLAGQRMDAVFLHLDRERRGLDVAIFLAEVVADHAVDDKNAVGVSG